METEDLKNEEKIPSPEDPPKEEVVVTIEGEDPPKEEESSVIKNFRKRDRDQNKRIKELEKQQEKESVVIGEKPTLEKCDFDNGKYETALISWSDKRRFIDSEKQKQEENQQRQNESWKNQLDAHNEKITDLGVDDFEDIKVVVEENLSVVQQSIIIMGADNSATVMYALGKNSKVLKQLAAIKDPTKFATAVGKLESKLKVSKRQAPPPDKVPKGTAPSGGDKTLDKLFAEYEKTGDATAYNLYKKKLRESA